MTGSPVPQQNNNIPSNNESTVIVCPDTWQSLSQLAVRQAYSVNSKAIYYRNVFNYSCLVHVADAKRNINSLI